MATATFKVSKKDVEGVEVRREVPDSLEDPRWGDLVLKPEEDIHELALQALIVKIQAGARSRLELGEQAVQAYVDSYKFGARSSAIAAPTISASDAAEQAFTPEQLEYLQAAGMRLSADDAA